MDLIDCHIKNNDISSAISCCDKDYEYLGKLLKSISCYDEIIIRVKLYCNWCTSKELCNIWNKMSKGNYTWDNIKICWESPYDYQVVINSPMQQDEHEIEPEKTIVFQMEPHMKLNTHLWGYWANPPHDKFLFVGSHDHTFNNCEWHISKTYTELSTEIITKDLTLQTHISTVLSSKYKDPGHKKRIDFVKYLDTKDDITIDVYGQDLGYKNYKNINLPYHAKDNGLIPYKYTFHVENFQIHNYFTEKIIDAILSECLVFYNGPKNIRDYIDERAFVWLDLEDFSHDYNIVKDAIAKDLWFERLPYIRNEKKRILNEYQFFPRIKKYFSQIKK